jgi:alpha-amylase
MLKDGTCSAPAPAWLALRHDLTCREGIPIIYQGEEQHYAGGANPENREALWSSGYSTSSELYTWITRLNQIRSRAIAQDDGYLSYRSQTIYSDSHSIATRKGSPGFQVVAVFTNVGSPSSATVTLSSSATGFEANQGLVDVMSCTPLAADSSGRIVVTLTNGLPRVLYPVARLSGSDICPNLTGTATTTLSSVTTSSQTSAPSSASTTSKWHPRGHSASRYREELTIAYSTA